MVAAAVGYAAGLVPSADFAAHLASSGQLDPREHGSGNPGGANATAVLGARWGYGVILADIAKGAIAARAGRRLAGDTGQHIAAVAAVVGHCYPVTKGFRGGKGVDCSVGQCLATFLAYLPADLADLPALLGVAAPRAPRNVPVARRVPSSVSDRHPPIDVYWRRGCSACASLRVGLAESGVAVEWHDIWADADAAAYVRSVARGNETVPTVRIGERVLVAPRTSSVLDALRQIDPTGVPTTTPWPILRIIQWVGIITLLLVSGGLSRFGQVELSWLANAGALAVYLGLRRLRAQPRHLVTAAQS